MEINNNLNFIKTDSLSVQKTDDSVESIEVKKNILSQNSNITTDSEDENIALEVNDSTQTTQTEQKVNYEQIYNELNDIKTSKNYDINGDGKVTYHDINALYELLQYNPTEIFSDDLKITKTRKDGLKYKAFEDSYTQKAKSAFESLIKEISSKVAKDTSDKFNTCKSESSGEELKIADFIELYNDLKNLPEDSLTKATSNLNTTLLYYRNNFKWSTAYAQASDSEKEQLQQIVEELSSDDSALSKTMSKSIYNVLKSTAEVMVENTNTYTNAVDEIASQLVNGDIPNGKSVTFSLTDSNVTNWGMGGTSTSEPTQVTITNKNGTYVYHIKIKHTSANNEVYYEDEYLTDSQIDKVLACATDLVHSNGNISNNKSGENWGGEGTGLSSKVKEVLGAEEGEKSYVTQHTSDSNGNYGANIGKGVGEYTFTNEFGQTSTIYLRDCDGCAGSPSNAVGDFLYADKIRNLLELAKSKSQNTETLVEGTVTTNSETQKLNTSKNQSSQNGIIQTQETSADVIDTIASYKNQLLKTEIENCSSLSDILKTINNNSVSMILNNETEKLNNINSIINNANENSDVEKIKEEILSYLD